MQRGVGGHGQRRVQSLEDGLDDFPQVEVGGAAFNGKVVAGEGVVGAKGDVVQNGRLAVKATRPAIGILQGDDHLAVNGHVQAANGEFPGSIEGDVGVERFLGQVSPHVQIFQHQQRQVGVAETDIAQNVAAGNDAPLVGR